MKAVTAAKTGVWDWWLTGLAAGVTVTGFLLAAFPSSAPVDALVNRYADPVFWPGGSVPQAADAYRSWVFGVTGAVMGGWGMLMSFVARGPFRRRERWAWLALTLPLGCWYVMDSLISVHRGVAPNAILNSALFALFALPLAATRRSFFTSRSGSVHR